MSYTEDILKTLPDRINHRNDLMITPQWVAKDMVNLLPAEVWNKNTTFLDPVCKSGIFLHEIYLKLMETDALIKEFPDKSERRQHILQNQLYGIALDPVCQLMTARTVYGTINGQSNIKLIDKYTDIIKNKDRKYFKEALKEKFGQMEFDVVIGNPPYQENIASSDGNKSLSKQLFPAFIINAVNMADIVAMITPSRWFTGEAQDGSFPKLRQFFRENNHIIYIYNFPDASEVFKDTMIKGGVNYFLYDKSYSGDVKFETKIGATHTTSTRPLFINDMNIILYDDMQISFINKLNNVGYESMTNITTGRNPFGIQGKESNVIQIACNSSKNDVKLLCRGGEINSIDSDFIEKGIDILKSYKVIISKSAGDPASDKKVIGKPYVVGPMYACTDTFITIGKYSNLIEAQNLGKYLQTKFVRYAISIMKISQNTCQIVYQFVPDQDFTSSSDIDWSKSISDIDQQLYKKYNLTSDEIAYIEKTIKPMQ